MVVVTRGTFERKIASNVEGDQLIEAKIGVIAEGCLLLTICSLFLKVQVLLSHDPEP